MQQGVAGLETIGLGYTIHAEALMRLGEASMLTGQLDDALKYAERALTLARQRGQRGVEATVSHLLGEISSGDNPPAAGAATDHYRQALSLAEPRGMRPLVAHCHAGLAKLYRRTGRKAESQEHFETATAMYREMAMTYWLDKLNREHRAP